MQTLTFQWNFHFCVNKKRRLFYCGNDQNLPYPRLKQKQKPYPIPDKMSKNDTLKDEKAYPLAWHIPRGGNLLGSAWVRVLDNTFSVINRDCDQLLPPQYLGPDLLLVVNIT